jgi:hypothetical protein
MAAGKSTRLAIVEQSLIDILDRLDAFPDNTRTRELKSKARICERVVLGWASLAPTQEERGEMMKRVLTLNVEVMEAGRAASGPAGGTPPTA